MVSVSMPMVSFVEVALLLRTRERKLLVMPRRSFWQKGQGATKLSKNLNCNRWPANSLDKLAHAAVMCLLAHEGGVVGGDG